MTINAVGTVGRSLDWEVAGISSYILAHVVLERHSSQHAESRKCADSDTLQGSSRRWSAHQYRHACLESKVCLRNRFAR